MRPRAALPDPVREPGRTGRALAEQLRHVDLIDEGSAHQQALAAPTLGHEAHALIQRKGPLVVGHDRELKPVQPLRARPGLQLPQQAAADPAAAGRASTPITTCAASRLRWNRPPLAST